jgi:hypothetical protein
MNFAIMSKPVEYRKHVCQPGMWQPYPWLRTYYDVGKKRLRYIHEFLRINSTWLRKSLAGGLADYKNPAFA